MMPVPIHGKDYFTVAERVVNFREKHPDFRVESELIGNTNYVIVKSTISDENGNVISTGLAEEERGSTNINKTSAVENCETSAVGRALAFFGLAGTEIASADEVANAIQQQAEKAFYERAQAHMQAVLTHLDAVMMVKSGIADNVLSEAAEAWFELTEDEKKSLWVAPTKGGVFTTKEREIMQSQEFRQAHFGENNE
jgi:hypothetical protein